MKDQIRRGVIKLDTYQQAARVIALYLDEFCDKNLDYINMVADASRKASEEIKQLRCDNKRLMNKIKRVILIMDNE